MHPALLEILRCPVTGKSLRLEPLEEKAGQIYSGWLVSEGNGQRYAIRQFIPRFVPMANYAESFSLQWNVFAQTQLDSHSGHPISATRFWGATEWKPEALRDQYVLDVGCGAGRFAEVALDAGAKVIALDYSNAVEACYENLQKYSKRLHVIQGDIYGLPLRRNSFSFVYCLGVLQHTPDVAGAFAALPPMLASGGSLVVDVYRKSASRMLLPKYWLRPLTRRIANETLFQILRRAVPTMFNISCMVGRLPLLGCTLRRLIPVANYTDILPLTSRQLLEWALLDTFDWLSPRYDKPQTAATLRRWLSDAGLTDVEVEQVGHLVGRGRRAAT